LREEGAGENKREKELEKDREMKPARGRKRAIFIAKTERE